MPLWRASTAPATEPDAIAPVHPEEGTAALEFIAVGLLLLVPIVYLVITLGTIKGQSVGVVAGARHIGRAVATAPDAATASSRADRVLAAVTDEYGLDPATVDVTVGCTNVGAACPEAGATLVVTVAAEVALPLVPPVLGLERVARVPVEATSAQKVSRTWGAG